MGSLKRSKEGSLVRTRSGRKKEQRRRDKERSKAGKPKLALGGTRCQRHFRQECLGHTRLRDKRCYFYLHAARLVSTWPWSTRAFAVLGPSIGSGIDKSTRKRPITRPPQTCPPNPSGRLPPNRCAQTATNRHCHRPSPTQARQANTAACDRVRSKLGRPGCQTTIQKKLRSGGGRGRA